MSPPADLSRFRGTFHSFDPVGFAIFAIPSRSARKQQPFAELMSPAHWRRSTQHVKSPL
jgi:hypothetical protein